MGYNPQESLENTINTVGTLLGVHPIVPWLYDVFFLDSEGDSELAKHGTSSTSQVGSNQPFQKTDSALSRWWFPGMCLVTSKWATDDHFPY